MMWLHLYLVLGFGVVCLATGFRAFYLPRAPLQDSRPFLCRTSQQQELASITRENVGTSLVNAGECVSKAACILPNWYSSKEGLTGESPAVFGSAGTALCQAGEAISTNGIQACISDLFLAACALEPIGLDTCMEAVAVALEKSADGDNDCLLQAAMALDESANEFDEYRKALDAEEHQSDHDRETAGGLLQTAATSLREAANSLRQQVQQP